MPCHASRWRCRWPAGPLSMPYSTQVRGRVNGQGRRHRIAAQGWGAAEAGGPPRLPRRAPAGAAQPAAQQSAFGAASSSCAASSVLLRSIATSAARLAEHTVAVPSMGESITEGTVATILKKPGE